MDRSTTTKDTKDETNNNQAQNEEGQKSSSSSTKQTVCQNCNKLNDETKTQCIECNQQITNNGLSHDKAMVDTPTSKANEIEPQSEDERHEGEEGRDSKGMPNVIRVSKEERDNHERTHTPYRPWCKYCVQGRGKASQHKQNPNKDKDKEVPRLSMDYFFMSSEGQKAHQNPILVMVNKQTGEKYARAVGQKGLGMEKEMDWLIEDLSAEVKSLGHQGGTGGKIIFNTDGEPAIKKLAEVVAKYHGGTVIPETAPKGESQSNGTAEEAGKTVR